jgi:hypothetical protein
MHLGSFRVKTPCCKSRALLFRVTSADQRLRDLREAVSVLRTPSSWLLNAHAQSMSIRQCSHDRAGSAKMMRATIRAELKNDVTEACVKWASRRRNVRPPRIPGRTAEPRSSRRLEVHACERNGRELFARRFLFVEIFRKNVRAIVAPQLSLPRRSMRRSRVWHPDHQEAEGCLRPP